MHCMVEQEQPPAHPDAPVGGCTQSPWTAKPRRDPWDHFWPCRLWEGCPGFPECCWHTSGRCSPANGESGDGKRFLQRDIAPVPAAALLEHPLAAAPAVSQRALLSTAQGSAWLGHHSPPGTPALLQSGSAGQ